MEQYLDKYNVKNISSMYDYKIINGTLKFYFRNDKFDVEEF